MSIYNVNVKNLALNQRQEEDGVCRHTTFSILTLMLIVQIVSMSESTVCYCTELYLNTGLHNSRSSKL